MMAEYIYENARGEWVACGDYDFARRYLLEENGWQLAAIEGEELPNPSQEHDKSKPKKSREEE